MLDTEERQVWSLGWKDRLEAVVATHSSILALRIPWTKKPGGLFAESDTTKWLSMHACTDMASKKEPLLLQATLVPPLARSPQLWSEQSSYTKGLFFLLDILKTSKVFDSFPPWSGNSSEQMRGAVFAVYKTWVSLGTKPEGRSQESKVLCVRVTLTLRF